MNRMTHYPDPFGGDLPDFDYLATLVPGRAVDVTEATVPKRGMFELNANNSKKRGRMQPLRSIHCEGTLYSDGHVNLNTIELPVYDFQSMAQMDTYLSSWGTYTLLWLDGREQKA
jgi:hypothetical protein